jgi:molybdopterin molybdotransferase
MAPSKTNAEPHPMVEVPEAIRRVLETTARTILSSSTVADSHYDVVASNAHPSELLGRFLAEDVLMREPGYPPYRASIMDGYAIRCQDRETKNTDAGSWTHRVSGRVHAGPSSSTKESLSCSNGHAELPSAVYVTTGARIPDSYDCVVPIEEINESPDQSHIAIANSATIAPNEHIRNVGCDIQAGSIVLPQGSCIHPVSLGLLQQSGQPEVKLVKKTRVGVLSTGNELLLSPESWSSQTSTANCGLIQTGQIPDVNKPILLSLLQSLGNNTIQTIDLGMERDDDIDSMTQTLEKALPTCDVILTTGGISMGETDIVEDVLVRRLGGTLHFGRLNMKPGKPTTFVSIPKGTGSPTPCLVFALPGNPVSATVCTHLLVRPALDMFRQYKANRVTLPITSATIQEMIQNTLVPPELVATLTHDIKLDMERPEYHRVTLDVKHVNGNAMEYTATSTGVQRSSRLVSLRDAQGLLVIPRGTIQEPKVLAGQQYTVLLLEQSHYNLPVRFKDSRHLNAYRPDDKHSPPTRVAITQLSENESDYPLMSQRELSECVIKALSGSRIGSVKVCICESIVGDCEEVQAPLSLDKPGEVDAWVVACSGSFTYSLKVSQMLRQKVEKVADALALQARLGAAAQDGTAALFEPVVGLLTNRQADNNGKEVDGCMLIALPMMGLTGGLDSVRGLLKHAVNVSRGKPRKHQH